MRELLRRPVMLDDILLGAPTDAVLDSESLRVVGLEIDCGDGGRRFLPLAAARIRDDHVAVGSALMLLENGVRDFYRRRTAVFSALVGAPVERAGRRLGALSDVLVTRDGSAEAVCVDANGSGMQRHPSDGIVIAPARRAPAA